MTETVHAPAIVTRRKIILCGFFGRGNAGDEAFVHAQHRLLSKEFDIVIALDKNAVRSDVHEWEPYRLGDVWSYDEFGRVFHDPTIHGVHVGGGSLPFGFAAQFTMTALDARKAVVISGVDAAINQRMPGKAFRQHFYSSIDLLAVRNSFHFRALRKVKTAMLGADWALGLPVEPVGAPIDVAMIIRESTEANKDHFATYGRLIKFFERQGRKVSFVPFSPEDDVMLDHMDIPQSQREVHWHDPRTVLGRLASANLVVSLGRLHALILGIMGRRPTLSIDPGLIRGGVVKKNNKNRLAAETFGLQHFDSCDAFIETADLPALEAASYGIPEDYQQRFDDMADRVMAAFVEHRIPTTLPKDIPLKEAEAYWARQVAGEI